VYVSLLDLTINWLTPGHAARRLAIVSVCEARPSIAGAGRLRITSQMTVKMVT